MRLRLAVTALIMVSTSLWGGSISGRVIVSQQIVKPAIMISPYSRNRYSPPVAGHNSSSPASTVIYIKSHTNLQSITGDLGTQHIDQRDISIIPHITVAQIDQTVNFKNNDKVYHNIFSLSKGNRFNLGRFPNGDSRDVTFGSPGVVEIFCDIHSNMNGVILVVPNTFFAIPDGEGNFSFVDLPNGTYTIAAWRENFPEQIRTVTLSPGSDAITLNFDL